MSVNRTCGTVLAVAALLLVPVPARSQRLADNQCVQCHEGNSDERAAQPADDFIGSIHAQAGFGCEICHGGNARATTRETAHLRFLGRPPRSRIPELCGRCHANRGLMRQYKPGLATDQLARYRESQHGRRFFGAGDSEVAICIDCHSSHAILPPTDPESTVYPANVPETCGKCHGNAELMARRGHTTHVLTDYESSVHWEGLSERGDLSAPVCNDCHGDHGAAPPGVGWAGAVCANCHTQIGRYFADGPHRAAFTYLGKPGCVTCHGNHAVQRADESTLGLAPPAVCGQAGGCHSEGDPIGQTVLQMKHVMDTLRGAFQAAEELLEDAELEGMPVDEPLFELEQGRTAIVKARSVVHLADLDSLEVVMHEGLEITGEAHAAGEAAFAELQFRRKGLGVSTAIVGLLVVLLLLKIRQIESDARVGSPNKESHS